MKNKNSLIFLIVLIIIAIFSFSLLACGDGEKDKDSGSNDSSDTDSDDTDSGETDDGEADSGETDDGEADAGETDSGETDAGETDEEPLGETLVPTPNNVEGTIRNKRPINFKEGNYGGTYITYTLGDSKTWNQAISSDATSSSFIDRMQPSLLQMNYDTGKWHVDLGDLSKGADNSGYDVEVKDDGTMELTIYLRKDIYWNDGERMTAEEWVYYWNEILSNPDVGSQSYGGTYLEVEGEKLPIVAELIDQFTFKYIYPTTMGDPELPISGGIMPMHKIKPIIESEGPKGLQEFWGIDTPVNEILSYGAWITESYSQGQNVIFAANETYFKKDEFNKKLPYLEKVIVSIVADMNAAVLRFSNRELSSVGFPNSNFKRMTEGAEAGGYTVWNGGPATGILFVAFNQNPNSERMKGTPQLEWFTQKEFRQAMNYLIDKENIVTQVLNDLGEPDKGFLHPASPYFNPDNTFPNEYNPEEAEKLLLELDIRDRDGNNIKEDKNNNEITFQIVTNSGNNERESVLNIVSSNWNAFGINSKANTLDFNNLVDALMSTYDWEAMIMGLTGGMWPGAGQNVWLSSGGLHFWNPNQESPATEWETEIDRIFNEARTEPDFELRKELWDEMYEIVYEQLPELLLYRQYSFLAIYDEWENVYWDSISLGVGGANNRHLFKQE